MTLDGAPVSPVLRWVGGKRWLLPVVRELVGPRKFTGYHEPFAGGAAVFFGLGPHAKAYLSDLNRELIDTYTAIRDDPDGVWRFLRNYRNTEVEYYQARASSPRLMISRAARFIFLNHASYNGIYRVNLAGRYNVPYGRRKSWNSPDLARLRSASRALQGVSLKTQDFGDALASVRPGNLVFLDPPYTVAHDRNGFIKYNDQLFSFADQLRLSEAIELIRRNGAYYILTNASHKSIVEVFEKGDRLVRTSRKNAVGGHNALRGKANELLFTNLEV